MDPSTCAECGTKRIGLKDYIVVPCDNHAEVDSLRTQNKELLEALEAATTVLETLVRPGNKVLGGGVRDSVMLHAQQARAAIEKAEEVNRG